jgi:hypothetical protein
MTLFDFRKRLETAWSKETSATPVAWHPAIPSLGQCAVTALAVQDEFGGELLRCLADGAISHYYNRVTVPAGVVTVDLTRDQFPPDTHFSEPEERTRDYVLSYPATAQRYALLKKRLTA